MQGFIKERNILLKTDDKKLLDNIQLIFSELKNHNWIDVPGLYDLLIEYPSFNKIVFYESLNILETQKKIFVLKKENRRYIAGSMESFNLMKKELFKRQRNMEVNFPDIEKRLIQILKLKGALRLETLSGFLGITVKIIKNILLVLEQKNIIKSYPSKNAKYYHLI